MTPSAKTLFLILSVSSIGTACSTAEQEPSGEGVDVTLGVSGKDDAIEGSSVRIYADGYTFMEPEQYVETSVSVLSRTLSSLALEGYGVTFDVSNYWETQTGTNCSYDYECGDFNQGYCDYYADWNGECVGLNTPSGKWTLAASSDTALTDMGFMLYDRATFESTGTTISCGGQNVFTSIKFDFDNQQIKVDDRDWYWASDCGLTLQTTEAVASQLSAFGVPVRDYALWDFEGDYDHTFLFSAD